MKERLLGFAVALFIFVFSPSLTGSGLAFAVGCDISWNPLVNDIVDPGTYMCYSSSSTWIAQCDPGGSGSWNNSYYDCSTVSDTCVHDGALPNYKARCSKAAAAPTPTTPPSPTPTPPVLCYSGGMQNQNDPNYAYEVGEKICEPLPPEANGSVTVIVNVCQPNPNVAGMGVFVPIDPNTACLQSQCKLSGTRPNRDVACETAATPTQIPTVPNAPACDIPAGIDIVTGCTTTSAVQLPAGSATCIRNVVVSCENGATTILKNCSDDTGGTCEVVGTGAVCKTGFGTQPADKCDATNNVIDADCDLAAPIGQQLIPQPGVNCGIPEGEQLPEGATADAYACCYSALENAAVVDLSCYLSLPGADGILSSLSDKINEHFNSFPLPNTGNAGLGAFPNIGEIKKELKKIPLCATGTQHDKNTPDAGAATCRCTRPSGTDTLCSNIDDLDGTADEYDQCIGCMTKQVDVDGTGPGGMVSRPGNGIWTALGCIDISSEAGFVQQLLTLGVSLGGAFAILCNIYAAFLFQTAGGSPDNVNKARTLIISCITGLLLIIFSIFILNLIGYRILRIPGLGGE